MKNPNEYRDRGESNVFHDQEHTHSFDLTEHPNRKRPGSTSVRKVVRQDTNDASKKRILKNNRTPSVSRFIREKQFNAQQQQNPNQRQTNYFSNPDGPVLQRNNGDRLSLQADGHQEPVFEDQHSDRQLIKEIQNAIEQDQTISVSTRNIQITAKRGIVTLRGTVGSEEEQMTIEDRAVALAGFGQVVNHLQIMEY